MVSVVLIKMAKLSALLVTTLLSATSAQSQNPSWHRFATNVNYRLAAVIDVNGGSGARGEDRSPGYSVPVDVVTLSRGGTYYQRISYYSGTNVEYNLNGEAYVAIPKPYGRDEDYGGGSTACFYEGGNETEREPYLNFFPTVGQMLNYTVGRLVTDEAGIPYRAATLQSPHGTDIPISPPSEPPDDYRNGMPSRDWYELLYRESLSTGAVAESDSYARPLKWTMLARNRVMGAHTEHWVIRYLNYETIDGEKEVELWRDWLSMNFDRDCPEDATAEVGEHRRLKTNRLGLFFSSSFGPGSEYHVRSNSQFDAFMTRYNKQYSEEEYRYRKAIHDANVDKIQKWNEVHAGKTSFVHNEQYMDMQTEEVLKFRGGHISIPHLDEAKRRVAADRSRSGPGHNLRRLTGDDDFDIENYNWTVYQVPADFDPESFPREFDWRTHLPGSVSPVKDQGFCGSCWAFSFVSSLESHWFITNSQSVILPEQFVNDCLWTDYSFGCDGGQSYVAAVAALKRFGGMVPAHSSYGSYLSVDGQCYADILQGLGMLHGRSQGQQSLLSQTTQQPSTVRLTDWVGIPSRDEVAVKHALMTKGPLSVAFNVVDESLYYSNGILDVESCTANDSEDMDHAINLVGWGVDILEDGTEGQHWILRNSWSTVWGDGGYLKVRMGERDCGVTTDAGFPVVEKIGKESVVA